jgi:predicted transcriptional regulator
MSKRRITIDVESALLAAVDDLARRSGRSRNLLLTECMEHWIQERERERVDRAFEEMGRDAGYGEELARIESEMGSSSAAAWRILDRAGAHAPESQKPDRRSARRAAR